MPRRKPQGFTRSTRRMLRHGGGRALGGVSLLVLLVWSALATAEPPPANQATLQQLDRVNADALRRIQKLPPPTPDVEQYREQRDLDRQQQSAQQQLQERQHRQNAILNHRARTRRANSVPYSLQGINQQRRFQLQQQLQLDRFRQQR